MQICINLCKVTSDIVTCQFVWYVVGGTDIFRCHQKILYAFKIHVWNRFSWFLACAEVSDQCIQCMSDTRDMYQKLQMRSDTHLRRPVHDEMGGTRIWKSKVSERGYRRFMCGDLFSSVMNDCDRARPCSNGTTDATCTLMFICSRRIHTNNTMTCHLSAAADALRHRSSWDSIFESRDDGLVGGRYIWKSDHDLVNSIVYSRFMSGIDFPGLCYGEGCR